MRRLVISSACAAIAMAVFGATNQYAAAITPDDPGAANVRFTVNAGASVKPISQYIYGVNFYGGSGVTAPATLDRLGGNRWSAYNWENNASNAGKDYRYQNDSYLSGSSTPGAAVLPTMQTSAANNRGLIVTVPMAGWVSADKSGQPVVYADVAKLGRFKEVKAMKSDVYSGAAAALSLTPNTGDDYVFTDEFVNWVESNKQPGQDVFYSLDNEPALWGEPIPSTWNPLNWQASNQPGRTHPEIHPSAPTYQEMLTKTVANSTAIKSVNPSAMVFGGVTYGYAEDTGLQGATEPNPKVRHPGQTSDQAGDLNYLEWMLKNVKTAEDSAGHKLMDVLDVHWYPEATGGGIRIADDNNANPSAALITARVQAPRSLWDSTYTETSWITGCCSGGPIKLLKNIEKDIDDFNPGTKMSITEYNYGGGQHISGGVAEADVLGIFGREGVFAASLWPQGDGNDMGNDAVAENAFTSGGIRMYTNYDGAGGQFGDVSIDAATNTIADSAVYASLDSGDPNKMVLVAINRNAAAKTSAIQVTSELRFDRAEVYWLTSASSNPVRAADVDIDLVNAFIYSMPAYSVSTLVLRSFEAGDFNGDGQVDGNDLASLSDNFGVETSATFRMGDNDRDGDVDGDDLIGWQQALGNVYDYSASTAVAAAVPEPTTCVVAACALAGLGRRRGRRRSAVSLRRLPPA